MDQFRIWFKSIFHRHKYTRLKMYPPRQGDQWGFLVTCDCGHTKLTKLPGTISVVEQVHSYPPMEVSDGSE